MLVEAGLHAPCGPSRLFTAVADLADYPTWLRILSRVEPTETAADDPGPAWSVELTGRFGPLARSKRLRMVRVVHDPPRRAVFERRELDGRTHATWRLEVDVTPDERGSLLSMRLAYDGRFDVGLLERRLAEEIDAARPRLAARLVSDG